MRKEILPIGTVCELADNKKVMVIGYNKSLLNNGTLVEKDYETIDYPYGTLSNIRKGVNQDEIKNVLYIGYSDDDFVKFEQAYNGEEVTNNTEVVENVTIPNPFSVQEQQAPVETRPVDEWPIFKEIKFDENGVAVSTDENNTPEVKAEDIMPKYQFDENGVVIGITNGEPEIVEEKPMTTSETKYQFDENGVIIGVEEVSSEPAITETRETAEVPKYQFDENGVIIGINEVSSEQKETEAPKVSEVPKYQFDENGIIIGIEEPSAA